MQFFKFAVVAALASLVWSAAGLASQTAQAPPGKAVPKTASQKTAAPAARPAPAAKPPVSASKNAAHPAWHPATSAKPAQTASRPPATSHTAATRTAYARQTRKPVAPRTTWRNRQMAPTTDRYKEIQEALVARGYMRAEDAQGAWGDASTDALKRFQTDQNLESSGKINSLSLIALGLGPRHDSAPAPPKPPAPVPEVPGRQ